MIDCYLKYGDWENRTKGFPIVNESQRKTAINWSGTKEFIQIPDKLENVKVDDFDDRMNNKIFKAFYTMEIEGKLTDIYFDIYVPEMLDIMKYGCIKEGVIQNPIVFLDRARLTMENGELHKQWLKKEKEKQENKETKRIPVSELKFGHVYKQSLNGKQYVFLGKCNNGYLLLESFSWSNEMNIEFAYNHNLSIHKSLNFKYEINLSFTKKFLQEYAKARKEQLKNKIQEYKEQGYYSYRQRAEIYSNILKLQEETLDKIVE